MEYLERVLDGVQARVFRVNPSTLSGAVDVIVVRHADGSLRSTPFHARFGKLQCFGRPHEKCVAITVNGRTAPFQMKLGPAGEAFFLRPLADGEDAPEAELTSPLPSPPPSPTIAPATSSSSAAGALLAGKMTPAELVPLADAVDKVLRERESPPSSAAAVAAEDASEMAWEWGGLPAVVNTAESGQPPSPSSSDAAAEGSEWRSVLVPPTVATDAAAATSTAAEGSCVEGEGFEDDSVSEGLVFEDAEDLEDLEEAAAAAAAAATASSASSSPTAASDVLLSNEELLGVNLQLSLCAQQLAAIQAESSEDAQQKAEAVFAAGLVTYDVVAANPLVLFDPSLMARINGKLCSGAAAMAMVTTMMAFRKRLPAMVAKPPQSKQEAAAPAVPARRGRGWRFWPFRPRSGTPRQKTPRGKSPKLAQQKPAQLPLAPPQRPMRKSVRPTQEQLEQLNLHDGENSISFSVQNGNNRSEVCASLYVIDEHTRIVVSDIDGTITKSDALGHVFTAIGRDWSQSGVAQLYSAIAANGYMILYLTSRCIGVARSTRKYIASIRQKPSGGLEPYSLPPGPVFMSPLRLLAALDKELVRKTPYEFKIACLTDILGLFPSGTQPLYAGFGNRETDVESYRAVGISEGRIFTINNLGRIRTHNRTFSKTYATLHELVDDIFPPLSHDEELLDERFIDSNFWSYALPGLDELDLPPPPPKPVATKRGATPAPAAAAPAPAPVPAPKPKMK